MAFCSAVYWSLPVPALTRSMVTLGYSASKSSTTFSRVVSQAHTVSSPPSSRAAWTSSALTSSALSAVLPPLPQALSASTAANAMAEPRSIVGEIFRFMGFLFTFLLENWMDGSYSLTAPALRPDCQ